MTTVLLWPNEVVARLLIVLWKLNVEEAAKILYSSRSVTVEFNSDG